MWNYGQMHVDVVALLPHFTVERTMQSHESHPCIDQYRVIILEKVPKLEFFCPFSPAFSKNNHCSLSRLMQETSGGYRCPNLQTLWLPLRDSCPLPGEAEIGWATRSTSTRNRCNGSITTYSATHIGTIPYLPTSSSLVDNKRLQMQCPFLAHESDRELQILCCR